MESVESKMSNYCTIWNTPTQAQKDSIKNLVEILKEEYNLSDDDVYEHDKISRKTDGEGANLYP